MEIKTIDNQFYKELGKELREIRRVRGYSLAYMGEKLGITRQCYDHYELGLLKIKPSMWDKICEVLDIYPSIEIKLRVGL